MVMGRKALNRTADELKAMSRMRRMKYYWKNRDKELASRRERRRHTIVKDLHSSRIKKRIFRKLRYFKYLSRVLKYKCKTGHLITPQELWSLAKRQRLTCPLSGRRLTRNNISIDHIIPLSNGGDNHPSNLRFVDYHANLAKAMFSDQELVLLAADIINHHKKRDDNQPELVAGSETC